MVDLHMTEPTQIISRIAFFTYPNDFSLTDSLGQAPPCFASRCFAHPSSQQPPKAEPEPDLIDQKCRRTQPGRCARCSGWFLLPRDHNWRAKGREMSRASRLCCWSRWGTACLPWPGGSFHATARVLGGKARTCRPGSASAAPSPHSPLSLS